MNPIYIRIIIAVSVAIIAAIIGAILAPFVAHCVELWLAPLPPDFSISINPMEGTVQKGGVIASVISIRGIHVYNYPVSLSAAQVPHGVVVTFVPSSSRPTPSFTSTATISVGQNVPVDNYKITLIGRGADGKEHNCSYSLTVGPSATTTTPPEPTPTPTPIQPLEISTPEPTPTPIQPLEISTPEPTPTPTQPLEISTPEPTPTPTQPLEISTPEPTPEPTPTPIPTPTSITLTYNDFELDDVCTSRNNYCKEANKPGKAVIFGSMTKSNISVPEGASKVEVTICICCNGYGEGLSGPAGSAAYIRVDREERAERIDSTMSLHHGCYYKYEYCNTFSNTFIVRGKEEITLKIKMSGGARLDFEKAELTFS